MEWFDRMYALATHKPFPLFDPPPVDKYNQEIVSKLSTILSVGSVKVKEDPDSFVQIDALDLLNKLSQLGDGTSIELTVHKREVKVEQWNGSVIISAGEEKVELDGFELKEIYRTLLNDIIDHPDNHKVEHLDYPLNHILLDTENEFADVNHKVAYHILCNSADEASELHRWAAANHVLTYGKDYADQSLYHALIQDIIARPQNYDQQQLDHALNHILHDTDNAFPDINRDIASYIFSSEGSKTSPEQKKAMVNHIFKHGANFPKNTWIGVVQFMIDNSLPTALPVEIKSAKQVLLNKTMYSSEEVAVANSVYFSHLVEAIKNIVKSPTDYASETVKCAQMLSFYYNMESSDDDSIALGENIINHSKSYPPEFITCIAKKIIDKNANFFTLPFTAPHKFAAYYREFGKMKIAENFDKKWQNIFESSTDIPTPTSYEQLTEIAANHQSIALFLIKNRFDPAILHFKTYTDRSKTNSNTITTSSS